MSHVDEVRFAKVMSSSDVTISNRTSSDVTISIRTSIPFFTSLQTRSILKHVGNHSAISCTNIFTNIVRCAIETSGSYCL